MWLCRRQCIAQRGYKPVKMAQTVSGEMNWNDVFSSFLTLGSAAIEGIVRVASDVYVLVADMLDCTKNPNACTRVVNPSDPVQMKQFVDQLKRNGFTCNQSTCAQKITFEFERRADEQIIAQFPEANKNGYVACRKKNSLAKCIAQFKEHLPGVVNGKPGVRKTANGRSSISTMTPVRKANNVVNPPPKRQLPPPKPAADGASGGDGCSPNDVHLVRNALIAMMKGSHDIVATSVKPNWNKVDPVKLDKKLLDLMKTVLDGKTEQSKEQLRKLGAHDVRIEDGLVVVTCKGKSVYFKMYQERVTSKQLNDLILRNFFQKVNR